METIQFWATVISPVVGVAAIIAAFIISHRSTKKSQQQIDAVYHLLDVFVAAQAPTIMEAKRKYEQQLDEIDGLIAETKEELQTVSPFAGQGARIDLIEEMSRKREQNEELEALKRRRQEIKDSLNLIQAYLQKTNQH